MEMSEQVAELFTALNKFQSELETVAKTKTSGKAGDKFAFGYAELGDYIEAAQPIIKDCGLAVTQVMGIKDGHSILITMLTHTSGQWLRGEYTLEAVGMKGVSRAQDMGAAITYARRYCYAAILGMASEDNEDKLKKEQESADRHAAEVAAQRMAQERADYLKNKRLAFDTATNGAALKAHLKSAIDQQVEAGQAGKITTDEFNLRKAELTKIATEIAQAKGFEKQQGNDQ